MKRIFSVLLITFFVFLSFITYAQEKLLWEYPVKPRTEEWKKLKNYKAKIDVCQVPEDILPNINTDDLTVLCLQYPILYNVLAFNSLIDGQSDLFARVHIILQIDPALSEIFNEEYNSVLFGGRVPDVEILNAIDSLSYQLIKQ